MGTLDINGPITEGRVLINPVQSAQPADVRFAPKATELLHRQEMSRCATSCRERLQQFGPRDGRISRGGLTPHPGAQEPHSRFHSKGGFLPFSNSNGNLGSHFDNPASRKLKIISGIVRAPSKPNIQVLLPSRHFGRSGSGL